MAARQHRSALVDDLWGEDTLPYTGRMMIPLLIPGLRSAFPEGAESLHYSSCEFQTRVTEMKVITQHDSPDTLRVSRRVQLTARDDGDAEQAGRPVRTTAVVRADLDVP